MAYSDDINALNPDHYWSFDGNSNDSVGSLNGTNTTVNFTNAALTKDATNCATMTANGSRISFGSSTDLNGQMNRKCVAGWFSVNSIQPPPKRIYGEGTDGISTPLFQLVLGYGNTVMFEAADPFGISTYDCQVVASNVVVVDRVYHFCMTFEGDAFSDEIRFFVDGVKQTIEIPDPLVIGTSDITSRGQAQLGDPSGASGVGGDTLLLQAANESSYQYWASFSGADAVLTDTEIRETLFERGALANFTISTNTEANMQTALDAIADSQGNSPCCIEVEAVSGGGDFTLTSDKVFDNLASIHFRYNGTANTLTLVNIDDTQLGDASIGAAPFGGAIIIATRQTLTVTVKDNSTGSVISGARVYIKADSGGDLPVGTEIVNTTTNGSGVVTTIFDFTNDQPITGYVRKGSSSTYYKEASIGGSITATPLDLTVLMVEDE
jgi:hypothetical protein